MSENTYLWVAIIFLAIDLPWIAIVFLLLAILEND